MGLPYREGEGEAEGIFQIRHLIETTGEDLGGVEAEVEEEIPDGFIIPGHR